MQKKLDLALRRLLLCGCRNGKQKSQVLWVALMGRTINLNLCSSGSFRSRTVWAWIRRPCCKQSSHLPANHRPIAGGPDTDLQYPQSAGKQGVRVCVCVFLQRELCIHSAFDLQGETIWSSFKEYEWGWSGRPSLNCPPLSHRRWVLIRTDILSVCLSVHSAAVLASKFLR